jgi:hypothetical protein
MHGEDDFVAAVVSSIEKRYGDLIERKDWTALEAEIEREWPSLDAKLVVQYWSASDHIDTFNKS